MGHFYALGRLLWRLFRFALFELPIFMLIGALLVAISKNLDSNLLGQALTWFAAGMAGLSGIVCLIALFQKPTDTFGSASFANGTDLRRNKLRKSGVVIGKHEGRFIRFDRPGHILTFAPTRSGKGVSSVIPNLLDHLGSVVVTDIKGENFRITAPYRADLGPVHAIAPFDPDIGNAMFNPVDFIRTGTPHEVDDARLLAEMIITSDNSEPNHWEREARTLITGFLLYIVNLMPAEKRNLSELRSIFMSRPEVFDAHLDAMSDSDHPIISRVADGFSQKEDRERASVISTAQGGTEAFESPQLAAVTKRSTFSFEQLKDGVVSVYVVIPPEYVKVYQPFLRLIVGLATTAMTRNRHLPKKPVLFLLDELPALGYMRPIEDGIGYLAGYGAMLWLYVQDLDQLQKTYRKWRSMIANCAVRQAFNVQDRDTAVLVSEMLGQRTVKVESDGNTGKLAWLGLPSSFSKHRSETGRPLLAPDEVMMLPSSCQVLFVQGCKPILSEKVRYFEDKVFRGRWRKLQ